MNESDWKLFRALREAALERFCERTLGELQAIAADGAQSHHARYMQVFRLVESRDRELASAFDNPRRSDMARQLALIVKLGLVEPAELAPFSEQARAWLAALSSASASTTA